MVKIKICGITQLREVEYLNKLLPDFAGFVFADSRRKIGKETAAELRKNLSPDIKVAGVFVNADTGFIADLYNSNIIDMVQLHGDEDDGFLKELKSHVDVPVIKALRVGDRLPAVEFKADFVLFDSFNASAYGGTGKQFDWGLLENFKEPYFLAGGLNTENIHTALKNLSPYAIDVSSGVESGGMKNYDKIKLLIDIVKNTYGGGL